jgi:enamine deaminase RidA (YjgF/YER057c/UK114 family)
MTTVEDRLRDLGLTLPAAPKPAAQYVSCVRVGDLLYISGNIGEIDGAPKYLGKVGAEVSLEQAYEMARSCVLNHLAIIKAEYGTFDAVDRIVRLTGYVNSAPGFTTLAKVTNGGSDLLVELFGDRGRHARTTIGVSMLARNAPVETELLVALKPSTK